MTDRRFFNRRGPFPLGEIARVVNAELSDLAAAAMMINDIDALDTAGIGDISVFNDLRYLDAFTRTRASVVVTSHELARHLPTGMRLLLTAQPRLAYAQIGHLFYPAASLTPGIDASAQVDRTATIGPGSQVDAGAVIGRKVEIGARCHIGPHVVLHDGVVLGENCLIGANSAISYALIGDRVDISTCVSIGGPGFGFVPSRQGLLRMLQVGRVIIEDDVEIGANCAIDRGTTGDTVIGTGTVIDNLVQIGHNVRLGRNCVLSGQVGIAGSTVVGDGVMIGGQAAISDHLTISAGARVAGKSGVMRDIEPGGSVGGYPAVPIRQWHRQTIGLMRLLNRKDT